MSVSIKEIAAKAGVSPATVSLALNDSDLVKLETKEMIKELAKEMGYTPNPYARRLVRRKSGMLGLIVPTIRNVYYADLVHYINEAVRRTDYGLIIATSDNSPKIERKIIREMHSSMAEGIMLAPLNVLENNAQLIEECDIPIVFTTAKYADTKRPFVMADIEKGMEQLVGEIVAGGRKRLALITGQAGVFELDLRERGFLTAAKGVQHDVIRIDRLDYKGGSSAVDKIINGGYDAAVCVNDMVALGVVNALMLSGVKVPEEIGVSGFDDNIFAKTSAVPITTVRQDVLEIAEKTVGAMLQLVEKKKCSSLTIDCEIIKRRSI